MSSMLTTAASHPELVVLLDVDNTPCGTARKTEVHSANTPLHLAFSCHLTDEDGRVLITRRALHKLTWPGVWTNSFCGHPGPDENLVEAVVRRAAYELEANVVEVSPVLPDFRYQAVDDSGIVENEVCPVFTARLMGPLAPNPEEVCAYRWARPEEVRTGVDATPFAFSPWMVEQVSQMALYTRVA